MSKEKEMKSQRRTNIVNRWWVAGMVGLLGMVAMGQSGSSQRAKNQSSQRSNKAKGGERGKKIKARRAKGKNKATKASAKNRPSRQGKRLPVRGQNRKLRPGATQRRSGRLRGRGRGQQASRARTVRIPLSSRSRRSVLVENREARAYAWRLVCSGREVLQGRIPGEGRAHFLARGRQKKPCFLSLTPAGRPKKLVAGEHWIIRQGQLRKVVTLQVIYPPVMVVGERALLEKRGLERQWASRAKASSEWSSPSWSAKQVTGPTTLQMCKDSTSAWASKKPNKGKEWLVVDFARSVRAIGVLLYVNLNPGAVVAVQARTGGGWETVWQGKDPSRGTCPAIVALPFQEPVDTKSLRIILNTRLVSGWNEIDALRLVSVRPE